MRPDPAVPDAVEEAERLVAGADFIRTEQDMLEGYDYLAGRIRASLQLAFDHDLDRPVLINSTHQFARQGLDNPDAIYFHAYLRDGVEYVLRGRRGSTADLSFQVMGGGYDASGAPPSLAAFDDRELDLADDGTFELRLGPYDGGAKTLIVREVFNDWDTEERGTLWIERTDTVGRPAPSADPRAARAAVRDRRPAARRGRSGPGSRSRTSSSTGSRPTPSPRRPPPPGAWSRSAPRSATTRWPTTRRWSSPCRSAPTAPTRPIQIGSDWYASTDYETHQTSLTKAQAVTDPDGLMRFVISEREPRCRQLAGDHRSPHRPGDAALAAARARPRPDGRPHGRGA